MPSVKVAEARETVIHLSETADLTGPDGRAVSARIVLGEERVRATGRLARSTDAAAWTFTCGDAAEGGDRP
jgi:hypothetical protein